MTNQSAYWEILIGLLWDLWKLQRITSKMWNLGKDRVGDLWVKWQKEDSQLKIKEKGRSSKGALEVTTGKISLKIITKA